jgi:hypothetical protein
MRLLFGGFLVVSGLAIAAVGLDRTHSGAVPRSSAHKGAIRLDLRGTAERAGEYHRHAAGKTAYP